MRLILLILIAVGSVSADLPGVLSALELLQERLDGDLKFAEVHALMDLDNFAQHIEKGIAEILKNPARGTKELFLNLSKDLYQGRVWAQEDYRMIRRHLKEAIQIIKEELKPTERPEETNVPM